MAGSKNTTGPKPVFINNIVTPVGRVSFPHLAEPDRKGAGKPFADDKYKATLLLPKDGTDFSTLRAKALECAQAAFGPSIKTLNDFAHPFRDGSNRTSKDGEVLDGYDGCLYITCKSKDRPLVIDRNKANIDPKEVYGGCKARFVVTAMSYSSTANVRQVDGTVKREVIRGVTLLLDVVQKVGDDTPFSGGKAKSAAALPDDLGDDGAEAVAEVGAGPEEVSEADAEAMFR